MLVKISRSMSVTCSLVIKKKKSADFPFQFQSKKNSINYYSTTTNHCIFVLFHIADVLTYLNVLACSINQQPWECIYQRSGRLFDIIDDALVEKVTELKGKFFE